MRLMRTVARRVALSLSEAKRFTVLNEVFAPLGASALQYQYAVRNVFAPIPVAAGSAAGASYSRIGSEIVDPLLKLKFSWRFNWANANASTYWGPVFLHVYLVAANDASTFPLNGVSIYPDGIAGDPGWLLQTNPARPTLNGNNVKVLKAWHRKMQPPPSVAGTGGTDGVIAQYFGRGNVNGKMTYRWKRKLTYEDFVPLSANPSSGNQLRGWNYYILTGWGINDQTLGMSQAPICNVDSFLYFKDP